MQPGETFQPAPCPTPARRTVAVVEDKAAVREQWQALIDAFPGFACIAACATGEEAATLLPGHRPDVVLMDIYLPGMSGIECTARLKEAMPACRVLILTASSDEELVFPALEAGADGYLLKQARPEDLLRSLQDVLGGGVPMTAGIARRVAAFFRARSSTRKQVARLSNRETEILDLIARGFGNKEIADRLGLSVETVRSYLKTVYEKMHVHSRAEAVAKYMRG